jgi:serine/threonine protein kinase
LHEHDPPIVHRDVKTLNFLVNKDWKVKVSDFGLSRFTTLENNKSLKNICGTVTYLAPEVYQGTPSSTASDIYRFGDPFATLFFLLNILLIRFPPLSFYSEGIVLWELLHRTITGAYSSPYQEFGFVSDFQVLAAASQGQTPTIPSSTPEPLVTVLKWTLNLEPQERPTASQLYERLCVVRNEYQQAKTSWNGAIVAPKST